MTQFIQKSSYETTELDGEWIILNTDNYTITKINEIGGICWSFLKEPQTIDSLTEFLLENNHTSQDAEIAKKDIDIFLSSLVEYGLIEQC